MIATYYSDIVSINKRKLQAAPAANRQHPSLNKEIISSNTKDSSLGTVPIPIDEGTT